MIPKKLKFGFLSIGVVGLLLLVFSHSFLNSFDYIVEDITTQFGLPPILFWPIITLLIVTILSLFFGYRYFFNPKRRISLRKNFRYFFDRKKRRLRKNRRKMRRKRK